jgi:hypothetical protein
MTDGAPAEAMIPRHRHVHSFLLPPVGKPKAESLWPRAYGQEPMAKSLWPKAYGQKPKEGLYSQRFLGFESLYIQVLDHYRLERLSK